MSAALSSESSNISVENITENKEVETFNKLITLEKDLLKLKDIMEEMKKIKKSCAVSAELEEINASRKK
jgi:hypothetical protein